MGKLKYGRVLMKFFFISTIIVWISKDVYKMQPFWVEKNPLEPLSQSF